MKKALMCILLNLVGLGALAAAFFMAQNGVSLFWLILMIMVAACFLLSPYKPLVMFGICLVFVLLGFAIAFCAILYLFVSIVAPFDFLGWSRYFKIVLSWTDILLDLSTTPLLVKSAAILGLIIPK